MGLDPRRELLSAVAYTMHQRGESGSIIERQDLIRTVAACLPDRADLHEVAWVFVDELPVHIGLLEEVQPDHFRFRYLLFQEFLAARHVAETDQWDDLLVRYQENWWREVILLCAGHLSQERCWRFLEQLMAQGNTPTERATALGVTADVLVELGKCKGSSRIKEQIMQQARGILVAQPASAALPAARVACGRLLVKLGYFLQVLYGESSVGSYWCFIEASTFWHGDDRREKLQQVSIDSNFSIARYPLTNAEYAHFIATGGYERWEWWTAQGWQWIRQRQYTQPDRFDSERYNNPSQPVVGISWYEAAAYCCWLTQQGHSQGWLSSEEEIRLPTWLEWERAARHTDQRSYPWGEEEPTAEHANYTETGIERPSPVGCFPTGAVVCGAQDMAGNVQEWTSTSSENVTDPVPLKDFTPDQGVVRTSSDFSEPAEKLVCGARHKNDPTARTSFRGFRLVRSLRSST